MTYIRMVSYLNEYDTSALRYTHTYQYGYFVASLRRTLYAAFSVCMYCTYCLRHLRVTMNDFDACVC
jgi:hypothetical protein